MEFLRLINIRHRDIFHRQRSAGTVLLKLFAALFLSYLQITFMQTAVAAVNEDKLIKIGMTAPLDGPTKELGRSLRDGIEAYFTEVNQNGGIHGLKIKLICLDDAYQPVAAVRNMLSLIDEHQVLATIGNVGTPTALATIPIANEKKVLMFGAFTGAPALRKTPPDRYVINYRASYEEETSAIVDALLEAGIRPQEIAFFTQNDGYGDAGYNGAIKALKKNGFAKTEQLAHGRYPRNTIDVEEAIISILEAAEKPKVVIMVSTYSPSVKFIHLMQKIYADIRFINISFGGSSALASTLGKQGDGIIISQVVPHYSSELSGVKAYRESLLAFNPQAQIDFISLEGYLIAKILAEALQQAGSNVTRESLIDAVESLKSLDIGIEVPISYSSEQHQSSHRVWPTVIKGGEVQPMEWSEIIQ